MANAIENQLSNLQTRVPQSAGTQTTTEGVTLLPAFSRALEQRGIAANRQIDLQESRGLSSLRAQLGRQGREISRSQSRRNIRGPLADRDMRFLQQAEREQTARLQQDVGAARLDVESQLASQEGAALQNAELQRQSFLNNLAILREEARLIRKQQKKARKRKRTAQLIGAAASLLGLGIGAIFQNPAAGLAIGQLTAQGAGAQTGPIDTSGFNRSAPQTATPQVEQPGIGPATLEPILQGIAPQATTPQAFRGANQPFNIDDLLRSGAVGATRGVGTPLR